MVNSIDGGIAIDGTSGGLGNATDHQVLKALRATADLIIVGASTARTERYRPPTKPNQRIGLATNSGRFDYDSELITSGSGFMLAPESAVIPSGVEVLRAGSESLDIRTAVPALGEFAPGVELVVAEGGPRFNGALLDADLVDEICLTTAPFIIGGPSTRIIGHAGEQKHPMRLAHSLLDDESYQFQRWVRADTP